MLLDYDLQRAAISAGYLAYLRGEPPTGDTGAGATAAFAAAWFGRELHDAINRGEPDATIAWLCSEVKGAAQAAEGCDPSRWANLATRILTHPAATACFLADMPAEVLYA